MSSAAHGVGDIGLECLMNRANIYFTSGYRFSGQLDVEALQASFLAISGAVRKFEYRMHFESQTHYAWKPAGIHHKHFRVIDCDDIDREFGELCRHSLSLTDESAHCAMAIAVLRQRGSAEFIIAQTSEHTYLDARSSEVLFNRMIDHYNATLRGNVTGQQAAINAVRALRTIPAHEMLDILGLDDTQHESNMDDLGNYPVADDGKYAIPLHEVPGRLEAYRKERRAPIIRFFKLDKLLQRCREHTPDVTQNSAICAALAKGFHALNCAERKTPEQHTISFKMLSDLLDPELRAQYGGNYIAFVPVSVDGDQPIEVIARQINERIREFKAKRIDVSLFRFVEDAVRQGLVGTVDDPLSFVVTNWNNYTFLNNPDYLHGCRSIRHQSGVNIDPRDTLGAVLVNRPILVINISGPNEVCLSFFPSLRSDAENAALAERISEAFAS